MNDPVAAWLRYLRSNRMVTIGTVNTKYAGTVLHIQVGDREWWISKEDCLPVPAPDDFEGIQDYIVTKHFEAAEAEATAA